MNMLGRHVQQSDSIRPNILVVDDEPEIRDSLALILEDRYDLTMAESGEEALSKLRTHNDIKMVFLDYKLPGMSGLDFLRALQQDSIRVPVVMVTGRGTRDIAAQAYQFQVEDYIIKPFRVKEIEDTVMKILKKDLPKRTPVARAKQIINKGINQPVSTQRIAKLAGIGYRQLAREFKARTGMTIIEYKNSRRIERAKKYLREKDWNIEEVATAVGFKRQNYFSYLFRKLVGMTPTEYRKKHR